MAGEGTDLRPENDESISTSSSNIQESLGPNLIVVNTEKQNKKPRENEVILHYRSDSFPSRCYSYCSNYIF